MSHSTLFFGGNKKTREDTIFKDVPSNASPDVLIISKPSTKKSIGIDQIREGINFLNEKPFELTKKYLVIPEANLLTTEAQNALLKTLEEPSLYANIKLGTKTEQDLLDTVVSRCKKADLHKTKGVGEGEKKNTMYEYKNIRNSSVGERLDIVEKLAKEEKIDILEIIEKWVHEERRFMVEGVTGDTKTIEVLIKVFKDLENTNMNTKLLLEFLAISV